MNWLDQAERRFGSLAVPHLLRYVAGLNGLVFVLCQLKPAFIKALELDPAAVLQGEVWRLVSHLFIPLFGGLLPSWLGAAFYLLFLVWLGDGLEEAMGVFRLNVYYALGALGTTVAGFILGDGAGGFLLNNSLVFAFAWHYPTLQVYMFFIIPLRIKWLAIFDAAVLAMTFIRSGWGYRVGVVVALANFLIFFGPQWLASRGRQRVAANRRKQFSEAAAPVETLHCCHVCGRTEVTSPELEFRVSADGNTYCEQHLQSRLSAL
jgi:hypothetical protein